MSSAHEKASGDGSSPDGFHGYVPVECHIVPRNMPFTRKAGTLASAFRALAQNLREAASLQAVILKRRIANAAGLSAGGTGAALEKKREKKREASSPPLITQIC
jgi:hypothetical protein